MLACKLMRGCIEAIASKLTHSSVGAWLARDAGASVSRIHRVIVHRGQASLPLQTAFQL
jgi:hypothetical protein